MTHTANHARPALRRAAALLLAAAALPSTALAQETVTPPTVLVPAPPAPAPAPVPAPVTPPIVQTTPSTPVPPGESRTTIAPGVLEQAEQEARERAAARQAEARRARAERAAPRPAARTAAPAAEPVADPVPQTATPQPAPPVAAPPAPVEQVAPETAPVADAVPEPVEEAGANGTLWLILAALGGVAVVIAGAMLLRRRREDEPYLEEEVAVAAPVAERPAVEPRIERPVERPIADPVAAAPLFTAVTPPRAEVARSPMLKPRNQADESPSTLENAEMVEADPADVAAVLGGAKPSGKRPQLELAMRPVRAGMSRRGAMVGFELTVANAGGVDAEDVRIGAFMLGGGAAQRSEIERMLVNPPLGSIVPAERMAPGDGATLEASVTLPREQVDAIAGNDDTFTPVLVADARYRLPDGREGRTAAAFKIGRVNGGTHLEPIEIHDDPSMYADIEAELIGVPAKV